MLDKFRYNLDADGSIYSCGYIVDGKELDGSEPFTSFDCVNYWLNNGVWELLPYLTYKYFLIPSDMVPAISHYAGFVKEAMFHLAFNVRANEIDAIVDGQAVTSPSFINFIPCSCTRWTDEGLQLLDAVVENWNTTYPHKLMREPYKFESYNDLIAFRNANI